MGQEQTLLGGCHGEAAADPADGTRGPARRAFIVAHDGTARPCALHQAATTGRLVATVDIPPRLGVPAAPAALCWWFLPRSLASKLKVDAHHLVDMTWPRG